MKIPMPHPRTSGNHLVSIFRDPVSSSKKKLAPASKATRSTAAKVTKSTATKASMAKPKTTSTTGSQATKG